MLPAGHALQMCVVTLVCWERRSGSGSRINLIPSQVQVELVSGGSVAVGRKWDSGRADC